MDVISKNLGHASVAITNDIYAHLTPEVMEDASQKIVHSPPAIANAVMNAISATGIRHIDAPYTQETLWRSVKGHKTASSQADDDRST